jgi:hypothetical protein
MRDYKPKPTHYPPWVLPLVLGGVACLTVPLVCLGLLFPEPPASDSVPYREDFNGSVVGRPAEWVVKKIGEPKDVTAGGRMEFWHYKGVTRDKKTGKVDGWIRVVIHDGVCTHVVY